jgi:hypothetical protein
MKRYIVDRPNPPTRSGVNDALAGARGSLNGSAFWQASKPREWGLATIRWCRHCGSISVLGVTSFATRASAERALRADRAHDRVLVERYFDGIVRAGSRRRKRGWFTYGWSVASGSWRKQDLR